MELTCNTDTLQTQSVPVGRFAPSPSGRMHIGNVFSFLLAWLAARSDNGRIILRIEDLDPRAAKREIAKQLIEDIAWLGLDWDEGPYWQSERMDVYNNALASLEKKGLLYPCFCTRQELHVASAPHASDGTFKYAGTCRNLSPEEVARKLQERTPATRLCVPNKTIRFIDHVWGPQEENLANVCGDFLVQRSDGVIAYQLAVAVDDALMGVTQVVRGYDLMSSAARQIYIQHQLGLCSPSFAHIPLLVTPNGRRLSKRDHDLDLGTLQARGISRQRIIGALAKLVGLVDADENLEAADLVSIFNWNIVAAHEKNLIVDSGFLC